MSFQQHSPQPGRGYANSNLNIQQPSRQDIEMNGSHPRIIDSPGASRYVGGGVDGMLDVAERPMQVGRGHATQAAPFGGGIVTVREKSRTSCNFCTARKKRCDYVEINGQKQPCRLCKEKHRECVFDKKPPRKTAGPSGGGSKRAKKRSSGGNNGALVIHRASMGPSPATGLVGLEENMFVADFFDRLGFFPISNERNIQRAIMEVLFRPAIEGNKRRGSDTDSSMSGESVVNDKIDSETALSLPMKRTDSHNLESVFGGYAGVRRRWELQGENKAFSCMLWCTIAIGAMTSNLRTITVKQYVKLAEEAIDGLWSPDVATAKAYANMSMLYAFLDKEEQFSKHLSAAKELIDAMDSNPSCEEVPLDLRDIVNELDRILSLHYSDDMEVIKRCCYKADGEPPEMSPLLMCESGLFHIVRFYTDGVFKAFWRDVLKRDPVLSETKKFSEKHQKECLTIENIANTRPGLKDTGGALYIRAAMQFMRLPLKTDPRQVLRSSVELTNIICKVPGMIRLGPLKHYVHCLVMGLAKPAMAGLDEGAYEKLRAMYNSLDIAGPAIVAAEDMEIANLCKHPFCKGMAWSYQQKAIRQMKAQAQAAGGGAGAGAGAGGVPHAATSMGVGNGREGAAATTTAAAAASVGVAPVVERRIGQQPVSIGGHASAAVSPAVSSYSASFAHPSSSSAAATTTSVPGSVGGVHGMVHSSGGTVAADDAQGSGSAYSQQLHGSSRAMGMEDLAEVFSKEEVGSSYSQGIGGVEHINGGQVVERNHMFSAGSAWPQQQHQQKHQQQQMMHYETQRRRQQHDTGSDGGGDSNGREGVGLAAEKLMARHPRGGPSVSAFLSQPGRHHQQQQQQQQRYQHQIQYQYQQQYGHQQEMLSPREGEAGPSMSTSISSRTEVSAVSTSVQSMPMRSASIQSASIQSAAPPAPTGDMGMMDNSEDSEMPPDVYAYAQQQVRRQQADREKNANVNNLDELLLVNDDDRGDVPDMYEAESDAGDFDSFMAGGVTGVVDEQADDSLSSLAALLR